MLISNLPHKIFLYIFSFLYIFNPGNFAPFNLLYVLGLFSFFYLYLNKITLFKFLSNKRIFLLIFICLVYFLYLLVQYFFGGNDAILRAYSFIILIVSLLCSLTVIIVFEKTYSLNFYNLMKFIVVVALIQLFFVYLSVLVPSFREWTLSTARQSDILTISNDAGSGLRSFGLASGYTSTFPMVMGVCALFSFYLFVLNKNIKDKLFYFIIFLLIVFSVILNARVGLVPIGLMLIFSPIFLLRNDKKNFLILSVILSVILFLPNINIGNSDYFFRFVQGLNEFDSLLDGKKTGTFETLSGMWFFPSSTLGLLFGDGYKILGASPRGSDIGIVQDIYMFGVIPSFILGCAITYIFYPLIGYLRNKCGLFFTSILVVSLVIYYLKGMGFYANDVINLLFIMLSFVVVTYIRNGRYGKLN